ncbi:MAG: RimK/LysX family protein [Halioglobus sp.]
MKVSPLILTLTSLLLAGCSLFEVAEPQVDCPVLETPACPAPVICEQVQCPEPTVIEKIVEVPAELPPMATTAGKMHLPIIGAVEWVQVEPGNLRMEARIDSGAETTSIHAENIQLLEREGKRYVRYNLLDQHSGEVRPMEARLRRQVLIKQHKADPERRYVVRMWVTLGDTRSRIDVTLSDRMDFEYPMLVGRNLLVDTVIVDVSRHHTLAH